MSVCHRKCRFLLGLCALLAGFWLGSSQPAAAQDTEPSVPLGFHINGGSTETVQAASAAGGEFVVAVFSWRDIEPVPGYHYWEKPDAVLRAAEFAGLEVIARLDRPPAWAVDDTGPTPWDLDAYAEFVDRTVARYGDRLAGVIIWNEPNLALEWAGQAPDPVGYAQLLARGYAAAKARNPDLPVAAAGLAMTLGDGATAVNDLAYLDAMLAAGAGNSLDALAVHAYGFGAPPQAEPDAASLNVRRLELQQARLNAAGLNHIPLWITESGWRTSAPDPADDWQVVSPTRQADYTLQMLESVQQNPRITRLGFWELTSTRDNYGYALWQQDRPPSPAYSRLSRRAAEQALDDPTPRPPRTPRSQVEILAPDVTIRLGDIGTLHPHWVHLHRGGENFSPDWTGEFFLTADEADRTSDLLLETMQIDQPTNRVEINGVDAGLLAPRPRPDPTSTWVTQRLSIPSDLLQPGLNRVTIRSGLRNPVRQYSYWRWENLQLRNLRLIPQSEPEKPDHRWVQQPSPGGWAEINRIRREGASASVWVTGNRAGQLWQMSLEPGETRPLDKQAGDLTTCTFTDIAFAPADSREQEQLAATSCGLYQRAGPDQPWTRAVGPPAAYSYVVMAETQAGVSRYLAGFEDRGLWQAEDPGGPWRYAGLAGHSVFDMARLPDRQWAVATARGVYLGEPGAWRRLPAYPDGDGLAADRFTPRLQVDATGHLLARHRDRIWRWQANTWQPVGPPALQDRIMTVAACCGSGTVVGTDRRGLWQQESDGAWVRIDDGWLDDLKITAMLESGDRLLLATDNGLFQAPVSAGATGAIAHVAGLPATVTALARNPDDPAHLIAATPTGIARSEDNGQSWERVSPPWIVWDMALGAQGRLFVARADGMAWTDEIGAPAPAWTEAAGMETVTFFSVEPHPADAAQIVAGSWGNDIGLSRDRGATFRSLGNGLETLSVLDIFRHSTPGQLTVGTIEGLYRSDNGGESWFKLPGALRRQTVYTVHQTADGALLAGAGNGLWRSEDYGVTWEVIPDLPTVPVLGLHTPEAGQGPLWAGTEGAGLWVSEDSGTSWQRDGLAGRTVYDLTIDGRGRLLAGTDNGIYGRE